MRYLMAGVLSVAVLAFAGTGFVAMDFNNYFAACGFWIAAAVTVGLFVVLLKGVD